MRLVEGLLIAHAFLGASFLVAVSAFPWFVRRDTMSTPARSMLYVLCAVATGIAILTPALFCLGLFGGLSPAPIVATFVVLMLGGDLYWKQNPLRTQYWSARIDAVARCWDGPALSVYYVLILISAPAVIPNVGGDPVHYHLPYALDWAQHGRLVIDPYLRFPFYADNFSLLFALFIVLGATPFLNFLVWTMGLLAALGIYAASRDAFDTTVPPVWAVTISIALTFAFVFSATFLRWTVTGYFDSGQAAAMLISVIAFRLAIVERRGEFLVAAVLAGAFVIGLKESYFLLLPLYFFASIYVARMVKLRPAKIFLVLATLVVFSSPWYVRDTMLAGDPIYPALNIAVHGTDGLITHDEWGNIKQDLTTPKGWRPLLTLPARAFIKARSNAFREFGTSALILMLFVPTIVLFLILCSGRRLDPGIALPIVFLTILVGYWFASATFLRYAMLFYPLLAVCCALLASMLLKRTPRLAPVAALLAILAVFPSPGSADFYRFKLKNDYVSLPIRYTADDAYLRLYEDGYIEEEYASHLFADNGMTGPVYAIGGATEYDFRRHAIAGMGDWIGVAAYLRLFPAIQAGRSPEFVRSLHAQAVLVDPAFVVGGLDNPFERQLIASGFCNVPIPRSRYRLFVDRPCKNIKLPLE